MCAAISDGEGWCFGFVYTRNIPIPDVGGYGIFPVRGWSATALPVLSSILCVKLSNM